MSERKNARFIPSQGQSKVYRLGDALSQIHSAFHPPADGGDVEKVSIGIASESLSICGRAFLRRALGINLLNAFGNFFVVVDVKTEVIQTWLVAWFFRIIGV